MIYSFTRFCFILVLISPLISCATSYDGKSEGLYIMNKTHITVLENGNTVAKSIKTEKEIENDHLKFLEEHFEETDNDLIKLLISNILAEYFLKHGGNFDKAEFYHEQTGLLLKDYSIYGFDKRDIADFESRISYTVKDTPMIFLGFFMVPVYLSWLIIDIPGLLFIDSSKATVKPIIAPWSKLKRTVSTDLIGRTKYLYDPKYLGEQELWIKDAYYGGWNYVCCVDDEPITDYKNHLLYRKNIEQIKKEFGDRVKWKENLLKY